MGGLSCLGWHRLVFALACALLAAVWELCRASHPARDFARYTD